MEHEQIQVREEVGYKVFALTGQFVGGEETDALQAILQDKAEKEITFLIDMTDVSFANSSFLSALLSAHARITRRGGQIVIAGMSPAIAQVFIITKLDLIFTVFDTTAEAVDFIKKND